MISFGSKLELKLHLHQSNVSNIHCDHVFLLKLKMNLYFPSPHLQAPHRSQEPQDRRVQDDDGSGRQVARVQHQQPSERSRRCQRSPGHSQRTGCGRHHGGRGRPGCCSSSAGPSSASGGPCTAATQGQDKGRQRYGREEGSDEITHFAARRAGLREYIRRSCFFKETTCPQSKQSIDFSLIKFYSL